MKNSKFILPATSLKKIKQTILALHRANQLMSAEDLADMNNLSIKKGAISRCLPRLREMHIVSSESDGFYKKYKLTPLGNKLAKTIANSSNSQEAVGYWREAVKNVKNYKDLIAYIANSHSISRLALVEAIISRVDRPKGKSTTERANIVIDILEVAELIKVFNGKSKPYDLISIREENLNTSTEDDFMKREFQETPLESIGLDEDFTEILKMRVDEIDKCLSAKAALSVIFLAGSTLEGVLLGVARKYPKQFNESKSSPKDKGKVKQTQDWTLSNFIDVAHDVGLLKEDVKKHSHTLRDFRNYIHPYEQLKSGFTPDIPTAQISLQVLKVALSQLSKNKIKVS